VIFKEYIDAGMPTPDHFPVKVEWDVLDVDSALSLVTLPP
jgi:hypothetical protein